MTCSCGCGRGGGVGANPCTGEDTCECCAGVMVITPQPIVNRPGLNQIAYRVGTHGTFMATMLARLSSSDSPALSGLQVRTPSDPSIAMLDCWATIADVLTFYQERIANEGYLRTATERLSLLELASLVGYTLRPGLGASVYLAYTLQNNPAKVTTVTVPAGAQALSVPAAGQKPQTYQTSTDLDAVQTWNTLPVRQTTPPTITQDDITAATPATPFSVQLDGAAVAINRGDRLVFSFGAGDLVVASVATVSADATAGITTLDLFGDQSAAASTPSVTVASAQPETASVDVSSDADAKQNVALQALDSLLRPLSIAPSIPPADSAHLVRSTKTIFDTGSDVWPQLIVGLHPSLGNALYAAWSTAQATAPGPLQQVVVQRVKAGVFGATAPLHRMVSDGTVTETEWPLADGPVKISVQVTGGAGGEAPTLSITATDSEKNTASLQASPAVLLGTQKGLLPGDTDSPSTVTLTTTELGDPAADSFALNLAFSGSVSLTIGVSGTNDLSSGATAILAGTSYAPTVGETFSDVATGGGKATVTLTSAGEEPLVLTVDDTEGLNVIDLDAQYNQVVPGDQAIVERADTGAVIVANVLGVQSIARAAYSISGKVTRVILDRAWLTAADTSLSVARNATVYVQSDVMALAPAPDISSVEGDSLELDGLYGGLQTGRLLLITGERSDLPGVNTGEPVMVSGVTQYAAVDIPGDTVHTTLALATSLSYSYTRATVTLWGNVVQATQGAAQHDVLGSGDASQSNQSFPLSRSPLTYLPAPTPAGAASTLNVSVDGVSWPQVDELLSLGPSDRGYVTETDATGTTTVVFGDGINGARLQSGAANVAGDYRVGLGVAGNAAAGQISEAQTRPQGVQGVTNPLPASGGADPDTVDQARANAPIGVLALDRLVSVEDYQDFARAWAGIGQASSVMLTDDRGQFVSLTVGGTTADPLEMSSSVIANLVLSLAQYGDPQLPVQVTPCDVTNVILAANVHIDAAYNWTDIEAAVRAALLAGISYANRALGRDVVLSDIVATIQEVAGVDYATVTSLGVMQAPLSGEAGQEIQRLSDQLTRVPPWRIDVPLASIASGPPPTVNPAQIAVLNPDIPDSLILSQITS